MADKNKLSYTSRDFDSIKSDLVDMISGLTNIWTSREDSDPGIVLVNLMAALGDNLSYNMDQMSLEFFGKTVTQRKNAQRIYDLLGYKMHWYESAQVKISITNNSDQDINLIFGIGQNNTQRLTSSLIKSAPPYFILNPNETPENCFNTNIVTIPVGNTSDFIAVQGSLMSFKFNSSAIDENNRYYLPISKLDQNHIWLHGDDGLYWYLTENVNELTETLPRFSFNVDENNMPYIEFVPYWKTAYGATNILGRTFTLYYLSTLGSSGDVTAGVLNYINGLSKYGINPATDLAISHKANSYYSDIIENIPGKDPQTPAEAYVDSKKYIKTYNTLVTSYDFEKFFKRFGAISNALALDGQRANDMNAEIKDKYVDIPENKIVFLGCGAPKDVTDAVEVYDGSYKPYNIDMRLVYGNFMEQDPENFNIKYAHSIAIDPKAYVDENGEIKTEPIEGYIPKSGFMGYYLDDIIIGNTEDALIKQTDLDSKKLVTSTVNYGMTRKFPFFIDGQIHLKEPVAPSTANLILKRVYTAIINQYNAAVLEYGKKIKFSDMISTIMQADSSIDYFDAGANNEHGSLFVYPTTKNINPYGEVDANTHENANYEIDIDPQYFNAESIQHYEDLIPQNNALLYWGNTVSGCLSIAIESISEKSSPRLNQIFWKFYQQGITEESEPINYSISCFYNSSESSIVDNATKSLFEFRSVSKLEITGNLYSISTNGDFNALLENVVPDSIEYHEKSPWEDYTNIKSFGITTIVTNSAVNSYQEKIASGTIEGTTITLGTELESGIKIKKDSLAVQMSNPILNIDDIFTITVDTDGYIKDNKITLNEDAEDDIIISYDYYVDSSEDSSHRIISVRMKETPTTVESEPIYVIIS